MVETARRCLAEGEVIAGVVEAGARLHPEDRAFLADLAKLKTPAALVINKLDLVSRDRLMVLADDAHNVLPGAEVVPVSPLTRENVDDPEPVLKQFLQERPPLIPA